MGVTGILETTCQFAAMNENLFRPRSISRSRVPAALWITFRMCREKKIRRFISANTPSAATRGGGGCKWDAAIPPRRKIERVVITGSARSRRSSGRRRRWSNCRGTVGIRPSQIFADRPDPRGSPAKCEFSAAQVDRRLIFPFEPITIRRAARLRWKMRPENHARQR